MKKRGILQNMGLLSATLDTSQDPLSRWNEDASSYLLHKASTSNQGNVPWQGFNVAGMKSYVNGAFFAIID
jgi:hypothetical protein